jgi:hypothetical protein
MRLKKIQRGRDMALQQVGVPVSNLVEFYVIVKVEHCVDVIVVKDEARCAKNTEYVQIVSEFVNLEFVYRSN